MQAKNIAAATAAAVAVIATTLLSIHPAQAGPVHRAHVKMHREAVHMRASMHRTGHHMRASMHRTGHKIRAAFHRHHK